jgi:hypothetical protein
VPARTGGRESGRRVQPVPKNGKKPSKRDPVEAHGVDLPGGNLHREATLSEAGFMSPEQVHDLEDLKARPQLDPGAFAEKDHDHPSHPVAMHDHPGLLKLIDALAERVEGLRPPSPEPGESDVPEIDLEQFAPKKHSHPLEKHDHPKIREDFEEKLKAVGPLIADLWEAVEKNDVREVHGERLGKLEESLVFVRQLAEEAKAQASRVSKPRRQKGSRRPLIADEEGNLVPLPPKEELHALFGQGGEHHPTATPRGSGFMSPDHVETLNTTHGATKDLAEGFKLVGDLIDEIQARLDTSEKASGVLPEHEHPDLAAALDSFGGSLRGLEKDISTLRARPVFDPTGFATSGHKHEGVASEDHKHSDLEDWIRDVAESTPLAEDLNPIELRLTALEETTKKLREDLDFIRKLAEESTGAHKAHGNQSGGALHSEVSASLSGFMHPRHLKMFEDLEKRIAALE